MTDNLSRVCSLFGGARRRVVVLSAYVGAATLDRMLGAVPRDVADVSVFVRWGVGDIASGASDWEAWDVAKARAASLFSCPRLHAKAYVCDEWALVGSANATASGLGATGGGNLEVLVPVGARQPDLLRLLAAVERESTEACPFGADARRVASNVDGLGVWVPEVGPDAVLGALRGERQHDDQTRGICAILGIPEALENNVLVRRAVRGTTAFRIVTEEVQVRPMPMSVERVRDLLTQRVGSSFGQLAVARLGPLMQWLAYFGVNTHAMTSLGDAVPTLYPGRRLASYRLREQDA